MTASTTTAPGRSAWQTFRDFFVQPPPEAGPAARARHDLMLSHTVYVPAEGEAFTFGVEICQSWSMEGGTHDHLARRASELAVDARRSIRRMAVEVSRRYAPHRAVTFEAELNAEVAARQPWIVDDGPYVLICEVTVRVHPDERIAEQTRAFWERRVAMECEHDLEVRRAALVNELIGTWADVIEKLEKNPFASPSAKLAEEHFAEVFAAFKQQRGDAGRRLADILSQAVRGTEMRIGPSEYTKAWDAALTALLKEYGKE
ncbi:hypothetical protein [Catenuloplanes indicus]|uniref:Uncharacterized protein n=1 Tax=Catenuloplanes indicus TaxID=137267 RepID=A0AAE3W590_9ACTN|nr:hypothetical protein [Catenuloplanes indicus]MDQ0370198.1 hypothetical protein [Catenuloplanes indicus]